MNRDLACPALDAAILEYYSQSCMQDGCDALRLDSCVRERSKVIVEYIAQGQTKEICR